jgi:hypothetical protein
MANDPESVLTVLMSDEKIAEILGKIIFGQYVTDRERKDALKAVVDRISELEQVGVSDAKKNTIKARASLLKQWFENLREVNF